MKLLKVISSILLSSAIFLAGVYIVNASSPYLSYGSKSSRVTVQDYSKSHNPVWTSYLNNGRSAWNNSLAGVSITIDSSSKSTVKAARYSDSWFGLIEPYTSSGYLTRFNIKVNARTITEKATNVANFARSTIAHEYGHVFWLRDNPSTNKASIMKYSRNRNTLISPTIFDINNVKEKY